ncbi:MAG TPA: hypothetical protein VJJ75_02440 [Candidatus Nanoarchaeia archaeon]|nr:hypothetical protein [Candidatus Nanoarchaeia archaeon]
MTSQTQEVNLPGYVKKAITSNLALTEPYSWLSPGHWRELAEHVYADEIIPRAEGTDATFLQRGTQNAYGHGRRRTLNGILCSAVVDHNGVESHIPNYRRVKEIYESVNCERGDDDLIVGGIKKIIYRHMIDRAPILEDREQKIGLDGFHEQLWENGWMDEEGHSLLRGEFRIVYEAHAEPGNNFIQWSAMITE